MFTSNCQVTLFRRTGTAEGQSLYDEGNVYPGFFMERRRTSPDGTTEDLSELLLPPEAVPHTGDRVTIDGKQRTLGSLRCCTAAGGRTAAWRCAFMR